MVFHEPVKMLVREHYKAIDAQLWDDQASLVSEDFRAILGGRLTVSFVDWQAKVKGFYEGFPDGRHVLEFYAVEGDRILTIGHFKGTHTGPFMGKTAKGARVSAGVMHLDRVQ